MSLAAPTLWGEDAVGGTWAALRKSLCIYHRVTVNLQWSRQWAAGGDGYDRVV